MKLFARAAVISLLFLLAACGHAIDNQAYDINGGEIAVFNYSSDSSGTELTQAEKDLFQEEALIKRLQAMIELFENVDEAVIDVDSSNGTGKSVDVLVATKPDAPLTEDQKTGIVNLVSDCFGDDSAINITLSERIL